MLETTTTPGIMIPGAFTITTEATPSVLELGDGTYLVELFGPEQGGIRHNEEQLVY